MRAHGPELPNCTTRDAARDNSGGGRRSTRIHRQGRWRQGARRKLPSGWHRWNPSSPWDTRDEHQAKANAAHAKVRSREVGERDLQGGPEDNARSCKRHPYALCLLRYLHAHEYRTASERTISLRKLSPGDLNDVFDTNIPRICG